MMARISISGWGAQTRQTHLRHLNLLQKKALRTSFLSLLLLGVLVVSEPHCSRAQAALLNVTNFGARGDCVQVFVSTKINSPVITIQSTDRFSPADVGKVMCLFGAGFKSSLSSAGIFKGNYSGTPTNNQDMVVTILSVSNGTNATVSSPCGITTSGIRCTYGTQNKAAFDNCIAAAPNPCTIYIPAGNYLLIPPSALDTSYLQTSQFSSLPTISIQKGGLHFLGDGTNLTILTGNGAWQQKGYDQAYRGFMFFLGTRLTNDGPMIWDGIQFNGNATRNHSALYTSWPAVPTDGSGWDVTHHAIVDAYGDSGNAYKSITNCLFVHWHGETIEGIADGQGFVDIGNCSFVDGNATALNFNYQHDYHHNLFADYFQVAEDGQFLSGTGVSQIRFNTISNIYGRVAIALVGAATNVDAPSYTIASNTFALQGQTAVATAGIKNVSIVGNTFDGGTITLGAPGNQSTFWNSNIFIAFNTFTNSQVGVMVMGHGPNRVESVLVISNNATAITEAFGEAAEAAGSWSTNVVFHQNRADKGLYSVWATGQYLTDDLSNGFIPHTVTDSTGATNRLTYAWGTRQNILGVGKSVFYLDNLDAAHVPRGATLVISNGGKFSTPLFSSSVMSGTPTVVTNGQAVTYLWTNGAWQLVGFQLAPASNLHVISP